VQNVTIRSCGPHFALPGKLYCAGYYALDSDAGDSSPLIFLEKMLFTKSQWETPFRNRHDPFNRWRLAGIHHTSITFLVRAAGTLPDDPDGYSFIVADPLILVSVLEGYGATKPRLLAIDGETMVPVSSLWSYTCADRGSTFLSYVDAHGRLRACAPHQPDPLEACSKVLVWARADADAVCTT
jgi:hypothetical protein